MSEKIQIVPVESNATISGTIEKIEINRNPELEKLIQNTNTQISVKGITNGSTFDGKIGKLTVGSICMDVKPRVYPSSMHKQTEKNIDIVGSTQYPNVCGITNWKEGILSLRNNVLMLGNTKITWKVTTPNFDVVLEDGKCIVKHIWG